MFSNRHPDSLMLKARLLQGAFVILAITLFFSGMEKAAYVTAVFAVYFTLKFRDPVREVPADPLAIVSPVDGMVLQSEQATHPVTGATATRVVINVDGLGAYVFRAPIEGKLIELPRTLQSRKRRFHGLNIETDEGDFATLLLHGPWFAPPATSKQLGERVGQGERCGVLRLVGRAEVWLPVSASLGCKPGQELRSGETILAHFVH